MTSKKPTEKFAMDFVGFSGMGSLDQYEATIALTPDYDLAGVISAVMFEDGSRVITLHFKRSEKKLGRRGYSLEQKWEQLPQGQTQLENTQSIEVKP